MTDAETRKIRIIFAWCIVILVSLLPKILPQEILNWNIPYGFQTIIAVSIIITGLALTLLWEPIKPLRMYMLLFLLLVSIQWLVFTYIGNVPIIKGWLNDPSFNVFMLTELLLKLIISFAIIAFLQLIKKDSKSFFLTLGNTSASVEPVRWLGVSRGENWKKFGLLLSLFISLGTLTFLIIAGSPPIDIVIKALPFLPAVLLAAALNSFNEEMTYKASFLSVLEDPVGKDHALLLMAAFFGIFHFYGIPYGVIGVIMAAFLGWILGKSMLETRGMFWAWFIHFWQDVLIFAFLAIGSIIPGGN